MNKKHTIVLICIVVLVFFFLLKKQENQRIETLNISLAGNIFKAEVLDTDKERIQGLSGRDFLEDDTVILFVFEKEDYYGIWMKDMKFPIDIVWLDKNFKIVHIEKSVSPQTYPKVFYPTEPSLYVIEVVSGFTSRNEINIGDRVEFAK